ncbi:alpha/beta fold hydrolase [Streptomyces atroolivaceus]|uniref:Alpha/beta fold hydrolase n=1 Tax=Streptomyces atroolivaceus TaxID=66869 RepID=A0ABV9VM72_STRAZ|nr:alpha/beta hydrolase [Streptomyces atroolivaceus]
MPDTPADEDEKRPSAEPDVPTASPSHPDAAARDATKPRPRRWCVTVAVPAVITFVLTLVRRSPSLVGHWGSTEGQDRFRSTYEAAWRDLPEPAATLDIRTDYGQVRVYRFAGKADTGVPLVLLPGRASATPVWADNLPSLLSTGDVYALDLLGEPGMSIQDRPITGDGDQAAWLHQTLESLPEEYFHLVGLSIGGWTAVNLALREPAHIKTLTLIDPVHVFDDMPWETIARSLPASLSWLPKSWRNSFNSYTAGGAPVEGAPVARMIETGMRHYTLKLPQPGRISEDRLATLDLPVLTLIAGRSVMHDAPTAAKTAKRTLSQGTVRVYEDASHAINGEYPERIAKDITAFTTAHTESAPE